MRLVSAARPSSGRRRRPFSTGPISKRLDSNSNPTPGTTIETRRCSDRWPGGEPGQTAPVASPTSSCRPTWAQCYKTFCGRNSRMFVISWRVCLWKPFQPTLMLAGKDKILPKSREPRISSTQVRSSRNIILGREDLPGTNALEKLFCKIDKCRHSCLHR